MTPINQGTANVPTHQEARALSRWDNEGGAAEPPELPTIPEEPHMSNLELVQLRARVIALENVIIAMLAEGAAEQRALVKGMANYIRPRDGATAHPLTIHAADLMNHLADRAARFAPK